MANIIIDVIHGIFPSSRRFSIVGPILPNVQSMETEDALKKAIQRKAEGEMNPILLFGFEDETMILQRSDGGFLNTENIYYIRLPALLFDIGAIINAAMKDDNTASTGMDQPAVGYLLIDKVRSLKHNMQNKFVVMSGCVNDAQNSLKEAPSVPFEMGAVFIKSKSMESFIENFQTIRNLFSILHMDGDYNAIIDKLINIRDLISLLDNRINSEQELYPAQQCLILTRETIALFYASIDGASKKVGSLQMKSEMTKTSSKEIMESANDQIE